MLSEQLQDQTKAKHSFEDLKQSMDAWDSWLHDSVEKMTALQARMDELRQFIDLDNTTNGRVVMDGVFWELSHDDKQKSTPWVTKEWANARELLFLEALRSKHRIITSAMHP